MYYFSHHQSLTVLLILLASAADAEYNDTSVNDYVDQGIDYIRSNEEVTLLIDPLRISDIDRRNLKTWNMALTGLSSIRRSGDCILDYEGNQTVLEGSFAAENLQLKFHYRAKKIIWISGRVHLDIKRVSIKMSAYLDLYTGKVSFRNLKILDFGGIKIVKITGFSGLFNQLVRHITNLILKRSKTKVIRYIETKGVKILAREFDNFTYLKSKF